MVSTQVRLAARRMLLLLLALLLLLPAVGVRPEKALAAGGRESVSLNGIWDFYPDGGTTRYDITVPSYWDSPDDYGYPSSWSTLGYGVYKKNFTVPSSMAGQEIFLTFDQIAPLAKVFVNGIQLQTETDGYLMTRLKYKLDITSAAVTGGVNSLEVRVWASSALPADARDSSGLALYPIGTDHYAFGQGRGIVDDVRLESTPKVYVSDAVIVTNLQNNTDPADDTAQVSVTVTNMTGTAQTVTVKNSAALVGGAVEKSFADQTVTVPAGGSQTAVLSAVPWTNAKYWWTHDPKLYDLNTSLVQGSVTLDSKATRFGFRQFMVTNNYFQLNGIKTNLFGDALQFNWHIRSLHGTDPSPYQGLKDSNIAHVKKVMDEWKGTYNMGRTHIGGAISELYDYADQIGLLLIDENPFWQYQNSGSQTADGFDHVTKWVKQWVKENRNHPSIVIWSGGNENWTAPNLVPVVRDAVLAVDATRPIIQDAMTTESEENVHYWGGYPIGGLNTTNLYGLYKNNATKPKGEGESYTPSQGWPTLNADGTYNSTLSKDYLNDNIVSQAVWHRATDRMVRGMRYTGLADIRYYSDWIYSYEPIEATLYPVWTDLSAPGVKPVKIDRPVINVFSPAYPAFIPSDSYTYTKNTFSPVAAFDKAADQNNRIGVAPEVFTGGTAATRTVIVYNDEQRDGTNIDVFWEAGFRNPADNSYTAFQTGQFAAAVPYGGKTEQSLSFNVPASVSARWLELKLTTKKGGVTKFQESTQLGAVGSVPPAKISVPSVILLGVKNVSNAGQLHKIKLVNKGGGLSTAWSVTGQGEYLTLSQTSGNLRGEREIYFQINPQGLTPNTSYSKTLTFTEAGGSSATLTVQFQTDANPGGGTEALFDDFEDGNADGWTTNGGVWSVGTDGATKVYRQSDTAAVNLHAAGGLSTLTDYEVSAKLKSASLGSPAGVGLDARYQNADNTYNFQYYNNGNLIKIQKCVAGVWTTLASKAYTLNTGVWYTFKAVAKGNTLEFWVNGTKELTATDTSFTGGKAGLNAHRADVSFDDVSVVPILLEDNFDDGNAAGWTTTGGTWSVATDGTPAYVQTDAQAAGVNSITGNATWTDTAVSAKLKANALTGTYSGIGLNLRYKDTSNLYSFSYYSGGAGSSVLKISKCVNGTWTDLATMPYSLTLGAWYNFQAVADGSTLELWVNGTKLLTATDPSLTSGKAGLFSHRASSVFDDVRITGR
ncbi:family 16 glycoside hydrolase [Gorillibacterium sp. sgz5001074]|uniref:family 16 glycoside hydrolase n=1 Tax=Gorillibacterium sp. sgz5001074 TaxID=3446695 RepID=UPI003F67E709